MSLKMDWPCWEIMKCSSKQATNCPAFQRDKPCWEVMREIDAHSFNICRDCIVYVVKQKHSIFSQEEIAGILRHKGVEVTEQLCPRYRAVG